MNQKRGDRVTEDKRARNRLIQKIVVAAGTAVAAAAAVLFTIAGKDGEREDKDGKEKNRDGTMSMSGKKTYCGYIPRGCEACGGPYPICRDGCPAFDD